jgi:hypothetical protein
MYPVPKACGAGISRWTFVSWELSFAPEGSGGLGQAEAEVLGGKCTATAGAYVRVEGVAERKAAWEGVEAHEPESVPNSVMVVAMDARCN